jgi:hypothetical protein
MILGVAGAGELNQDYNNDLGYDVYSHPGPHSTYFECPLGISFELLYLCMMMIMMKPLHCPF